jgi:Uma2 family endonuclease
MSTVATPKSHQEPVLPFADGDRLSAAEFMRRYETMPALQHVELLEGVVYMPTSMRRHGMEQGTLIGWMYHYTLHTPQVTVSGPGTVKMDDDNVPEPDAAMWIEPEFGGQARFDHAGYMLGAAELFAEVAASSTARDLGPKFKVYEQAGLKEYIIWRVEDQALDWFILREGKFVRLQPDANGWYRSEVFPGLWLDVAALLAGDRTRLIQVLDQGLQSDEHRRFVAGS